MKSTANLGLKKPEGTDIVNIDDLNGNMDTLDAEVIKKASTTLDGRMSKEDKAKLDGIEAGANKYVHPATHPASLIVQDANNRLVTDAEKTNWNAKETTTGAQTKVDSHANKTTGAHDASAIAVNDTDFTEKTVLAVLKSLKSLANNLKSKVAGAIGAPLSATDDASQMESKINTIKSAAAANLTTKGVAASASESLTALVNKISQIIRGSGNAVVGDVLAGKTFTNVGGTQLTGSMPDYSAFPANGSAYVTSISTKGDYGGNITMEPPTGYYTQGKNAGGHGVLIAFDPNYKSENIVSGKSIFGVAGTAKTGFPEYGTILETRYTSGGIGANLMPIPIVTTYSEGFGVSLTITSPSGEVVIKCDGTSNTAGKHFVAFDKPMDFTNARYMILTFSTGFGGVSDCNANMYIRFKSSKNGPVVKEFQYAMRGGYTYYSEDKAFFNISDLSGQFYLCFDMDIRVNVAGYTNNFTTTLKTIYLVND